MRIIPHISNILRQKIPERNYKKAKKIKPNSFLCFAFMKAKKCTENIFRPLVLLSARWNVVLRLFILRVPLLGTTCNKIEAEVDNTVVKTTDIQDKYINTEIMKCLVLMVIRFLFNFTLNKVKVET